MSITSHLCFYDLIKRQMKTFHLVTSTSKNKTLYTVSLKQHWTFLSSTTLS